METVVSIEGMQELMRSSRAVDEAVRRILGEAVKAGADIVAQDARARAPVDTGALRRGIKAEITWDKNKSKAFAGAGMDKDMNDTFVKYSSNGKRYYYPASIEYGTKNAPARPFLRPALEHNKARVKQEVTDRIKRAMEGAVK